MDYISVKLQTKTQTTSRPFEECCPGCVVKSHVGTPVWVVPSHCCAWRTVLTNIVIIIHGQITSVTITTELYNTDITTIFTELKQLNYCSFYCVVKLLSVSVEYVLSMSALKSPLKKFVT